MNLIEAIVLAIVEGITEFLPISSTGHMIIASSIMGIPSDDFTKLFTVNIQFGAILSVVILYWKRFIQDINIYFKLFVAFIPAAIIGFFAGDYIDMMLENVVVVAISLVVGGIILIFVDNWFKNSNNEIDDLKYKGSFFIGLFQCLAMIPGVSRSAATIIGGLSEKLNRKAAAEFSFLLAVPTMFAASAYKAYKNYEIFNADNLEILIIGNVVAFIVAIIAIKFFIAVLTKYGFRWFGYYRVIVGLAILILVALGYNLEIV